MSRSISRIFCITSCSFAFTITVGAAQCYADIGHYSYYHDRHYDDGDDNDVDDDRGRDGGHDGVHGDGDGDGDKVGICIVRCVSLRTCSAKDRCGRNCLKFRIVKYRQYDIS